MIKQPRFQRRPLAVAIGSALALGAGTVHAQSEKNWVIEEVVVTAQMREQGLRDVPITVSAFDGNMMRNAQIEDAKQLAALTPGMAGDSNDSFMDVINIRGISTNSFGIGAEPSVGTYTNGVYLGRTGGAVTSMFDMERVEVVKGPQGTLFGRNASAGAISMITHKAVPETMGHVDVSAGQDGYGELSGVYNTPLTDTVSSRVALYHREQDDWITNLTDGGEIGGEEVTAGRVTFSHLGDSMRADLILDYEDREVAPTIYRAYNDGTDVSQGLAMAGLVPLAGAEDTIRSDVASDDLKDEGEVWGATLNMEFDLSDSYSVTSITGFRGHNYTYSEDFDGTDAHLFNYVQNQEQEYASQEFRLNYDGGGMLTWFLGASVYQEEVEAHFDQTFDEDEMCSSIFAAYYGAYYGQAAVDYVTDCASYYDYWYGYNYGPGIGERNDSVDAEGDYQGWGIYGDATFAATENLDITVGARYTEDQRDFQTAFGGQDRNYFWYSFPFYSSQPLKGDQKWDNLSARVAVNYHVSDKTSAFLNLSTGYKAGGFNTFDAMLPAGVGAEDVAGVDTANIPGITLSEFDEEEVTNVELGIKSMLWDSRLQLDASIYQYQFDGMQTAYTVGALVRIANAGDASGQGLEASMRLLPTENLDIYWGLAWADTSLDDPNPDFCASAGCREDGQLPGTIDFSSSLIATYSVPMDAGEAFFTVENFYNSAAPGFGDYSDSPLYETEPYKETNLRMGFRSDANWNATLWVTNLTDEFVYTSPVAPDANLPAHYIGMTEPRRIGLTVGYEF